MGQLKNSWFRSLCLQDIYNCIYTVDVLLHAAFPISLCPLPCYDCISCIAFMCIQHLSLYTDLIAFCSLVVKPGTPSFRFHINALGR